MRHALVRDGMVENFIVLDPESDWTPPDGSTAIPVGEESVSFGYLYDGETFSPPPEPETPAPVLQDISDRQFFHALSKPPYEIITKAEALAAVKVGELPASLQAIVDAIPDAEARYDAEMLLSGAKTFARAHPMVAAIAGAMTPPWAEAEIDAFWTFAASL